MTKSFGLLLLVLFFVSSAVHAQDFVCPSPSQQTDTNIKGELDGRAQTFLKLGDAQLKGGVEKTVVDLFSKYPNADRVAIVNSLISTTCNIIRSSKQMTDAEKLDKWLSIFPTIRTFLPADKSENGAGLFLDLAVLPLELQKSSADSSLGPTKFVGGVSVRGEFDKKSQEFKWINFPEYYYRSAGFDIRIIFGSKNEAISIFVGLLADAPKPGPIVATGDWPIEAKALPMAWKDLKFKNVGNEDCEQWVNTAASASLVSITCNYIYIRPGSSTYNRQTCYFSAGYSDGAFGVALVDNAPELSSFDVSKWEEQKLSESKIKSLTWNRIKDHSFNYFMLTCDEKLVKQDWN
jgi:hypothetical protein